MLLGSIRLVYIHITTELLLGLTLFILIVLSSRLSFSSLANLLECSSLFIPLLFLLSYTTLLSAGRTPFDLHEAESELVTGYTTELSALLFVSYFLVEYAE